MKQIPTKKICRFSIGHDEVQCVADQYYRGNPCDVCCYQDGREDMYVPSEMLVCPICGHMRNAGELICQECQYTALFWWGWIHGWVYK